MQRDLIFKTAKTLYFNKKAVLGRLHVGVSIRDVFHVYDQLFRNNEYNNGYMATRQAQRSSHVNVLEETTFILGN